MVGPYEIIHVSNVIRILKHSTVIPKQLNGYREHLSTTNNIQSGSYHQLLINTVGLLNRRITRSIDFETALGLYKVSGVGLSKYKHPFLTRPIWKIKNKKKFKRWVNANLDRMLYSPKEYLRQCKINEEETCRGYMDDCINDNY